MNSKALVKKKKVRIKIFLHTMEVNYNRKQIVYFSECDMKFTFCEF